MTNELNEIAATRADGFMYCAWINYDCIVNEEQKMIELCNKQQQNITGVEGDHVALYFT